MLPNATGENLDDLVLDFEDEEQEKTLTFGIYELTKPTKQSSAVLMNEEIDTPTYTTPITSAVGGKIDDLAAVQQAIYLMLSVEADQYIIYPYTYGINTLDLIGRPVNYIMAVLPLRISETLVSDDRITNVTDFDFAINGNKLTVKFIVHTIYGEVEGETAVIY